MLYCVLESLNFIHKADIIHRDIKSDNVLYNMKGQVKLADFGISRLLTIEQNVTQSEIGTVLWMAPEVVNK